MARHSNTPARTHRVACNIHLSCQRACDAALANASRMTRPAALGKVERLSSGYEHSPCAESLLDGCMLAVTWCDVVLARAKTYFTTRRQNLRRRGWGQTTPQNAREKYQCWSIALSLPIWRGEKRLTRYGLYIPENARTYIKATEDSRQVLTPGCVSEA